MTLLRPQYLAVPVPALAERSPEPALRQVTNVWSVAQDFAEQHALAQVRRGVGGGSARGPGSGQLF